VCKTPEIPGAELTTVTWNARVVKIYNTITSLVRFDQNYFLMPLKYTLAFYNARVVKFTSLYIISLARFETNSAIKTLQPSAMPELNFKLSSRRIGPCFKCFQYQDSFELGEWSKTDALFYSTVSLPGPRSRLSTHGCQIFRSTTYQNGVKYGTIYARRTATRTTAARTTATRWIWTCQTASCNMSTCLMNWVVEHGNLSKTLFITLVPTALC
jgi:hypothetical protein